MAPARFITFEGGEGAGKSTQARLLAQRLRGVGIDALITREPGGSAFAEQVRELILSPHIQAHGVLSEALLFYAARADHLDKLIRPALAAGRWVIADRFSDSTRVYQGMAGGLPRDVLQALERMVVEPTLPDLTFVLDIAPDTGLRRASERRADRGADAFEKRDLAYHLRLRQGFIELVQKEPGRCRLIDAAGEPDAIAGAIWVHVSQLAGAP
jgi:dTMP kinase